MKNQLFNSAQLTKLSVFAPKSSRVIFTTDDGRVFFGTAFDRGETFWEVPDMLPRSLNKLIDRCTVRATRSSSTGIWNMLRGLEPVFIDPVVIPDTHVPKDLKAQASTPVETSRRARMGSAMSSLSKARSTPTITSPISSKRKEQPVVKPRTPKVESPVETKVRAVPLPEYPSSLKPGESAVPLPDAGGSLKPSERAVPLPSGNGPKSAYPFGRPTSQPADDASLFPAGSSASGIIVKGHGQFLRASELRVQRRIINNFTLRLQKSGKIAMSKAIIEFFGIGSGIELLYTQDFSKLAIRRVGKKEGKIPGAFTVNRSGCLSAKALTDKALGTGLNTLVYNFCMVEEDGVFVGHRKNQTMVEE